MKPNNEMRKQGKVLSYSLHILMKKSIRVIAKLKDLSTKITKAIPSTCGVMFSQLD